MEMNKLRADYAVHSPRAHRLVEALCEQLQRILDSRDIALGVPIESRVKSLQSLEDKLERKSLELANLLDLDDLIGIRIILLFQRDVSIVSDLISKTFSILSTEDTAARLAETQFGYQSLHHVIQMPKTWLEVPTLADLGDLRAEIQVRTLAQHIWAVASHKLQYKHEQSVPPSIRRSIHRVSALLETVDLEFERVLTDRRTYINQTRTDKQPDEKLNVDLLSAVLSENLPPQNRGEDEPYAELLTDLTNFGIATKSQLLDLLKKHLSSVLAEEERIVSERKRTKKYIGSTKERIEMGAWFIHVGLVRRTLLLEFGKAFEKYKSEKYLKDIQKKAK